MKLIRFVTEKWPNGKCGLLTEGNGIEVLEGGLLDPIRKTGEVVRESEALRHLPPVDPPNIIAIGRNYADHAAELQSGIPEKPLMFIKATTALIAHGDNIVIPRAAPNAVDYEAELAVIIGRRAKNVPVEEALDYVLGYTCANDVSARDCQMNDGQWARGKSFDTFAPLGPHVVTDLDPSDLRVRMLLNGKVMQDQRTSDMAFGVAYLVSYLSHSITLLPGTVILTGTPGGVGFGRNPAVYLRPGDVCEVEIEGIGVLRNTVTNAS